MSISNMSDKKYAVSVIFFVFLLFSILTESYAVSGCDQVKTGVRGNPSYNRRIESKTATAIQFDLYNAQTDTKIQTLRNDPIVTLSRASSISSLNIEAVVSGTKPVSMQLSLDVILFKTIQNGTRYSLCGNIGSNFLPCNGLKLGKHTITATAYSGQNATGRILGANTVSFEIAAGTTFAPTKTPTNAPTKLPTAQPTYLTSTKALTKLPTAQPTYLTPTKALTKRPTAQPTYLPTRNPTKPPNAAPAVSPTACGVPKVCIL